MYGKAFSEREVMLSFSPSLPSTCNVNAMAAALEALLDPEDVVKP